MPRRFASPLLLALLAGACADAAPADCGSMPAGHARDMCSYALVPAAATPEDAHARVLAIDDPIIRDAAVGDWLRGHPDVEPVRAEALCALLGRAEQLACQRRATAPHLHRRPGG